MIAGRAIIVTGASRGIGAATARLLGGQGVPVIVNYSGDGAGAERVVAAIAGAASYATAMSLEIGGGR